MAQDLSYILYDTIPFGVVADTTHTLFQVAQGGDATHTKQFTNMRGSGQLPINEKMRVRKLMVTVWNEIPQADIEDIFNGNYVEIRIKDEVVFWSPLIYLASHNDYSGTINQAAAADRFLSGRVGQGYILEPNLFLNGGDSFRVDVFQDNAFAAADNAWFAMEGILTRER